MSTTGLRSEITARDVKTPRLTQRVLFSGREDAEPVMFVHGNISTGAFFQDTMAALPARYRGIAPTLRGFGDTEAKAIDATRGLRDFSDDLHSLIETLGLKKVHLVGWSVGGAVIQQYTVDHADRVASLTLLSPMSPYGFGGTGDAEGRPNFPDFAGSGGGTANPDFVRLVKEGDTSADHQNSPRNIVRAFFMKPANQLPAAQEDFYVAELLKTKIGDDFYPGDLSTSPNWPTLAPGTRGMNNAISPRYCNLRAFAEVKPQPPVLWIRGAEDQIVSDTSFFDFGYLGQLGFIPGWPGVETYPPQAMVSQVRAVLDAYTSKGGSYKEVVVPDAGHSAHLEKPEAFNAALHAFLG